MKWYEIPFVSVYVTELEKEIESKHVSQVTVNKELLDRVTGLEKKVLFLEQTLENLRTYLSNQPLANEIDKADDDYVDIDENYRIPIVEGVKIKQEGQPDAKATKINVISPREAIALYGSRQNKSKIKH